jgi:hypothetical protein
LIPAIIALLLAGGGTAAAVVLTSGNGNSGKGAMGTSGQMSTGAMTSGEMSTGAMTTTEAGMTTGMAMNNSEQPASQVMQSVISQYKWKCNNDPIDAPSSAKTTVDCATGVPQYLQINIYSTKHALDMEYARLLSDAGIKTNQGACSAGTWGGEQRWVHGLNEVGGRVFCYLANNKTYMTWTGGDRFLMVARMDGIDHPTLFYWWRRNIRHQLD